MPFELVPSMTLPPNTCAICHTECEGPYVWVPITPQWEYTYLYIGRKCLQELAEAMHLSGPVLVREPEVVEVLRAPTEQQITEWLRKQTLRDLPTIQPAESGTRSQGELQPVSSSTSSASSASRARVRESGGSAEKGDVPVTAAPDLLVGGVGVPAGPKAAEAAPPELGTIVVQVPAGFVEKHGPRSIRTRCVCGQTFEGADQDKQLDRHQRLCTKAKLVMKA